MTKAEVERVLNVVAEELEAADQADAARAYRRAADLVSQVDDGVRRRRRRTTASTAGTTRTGTGRRGRPRRTPAAE